MQYTVVQTTQTAILITSSSTIQCHTLPVETDGAELGLLVVQATQLSSVDLLDTIQVEHSHDPSAGLNFWASSDC